MKITFLGTSAGCPTKYRNVSAIAVNFLGAKEWLLVDCGEGTQHQLLRSTLSLLKLKMVLITHMHGDHCLGLPGLLSSASLAGRKKPLIIIGPAILKQYIDVVFDITQSYLSFPIEYVDVDSKKQVFSDHLMEINTFPLSHRINSHAYQFKVKNNKNKLDVFKLKKDEIPMGEIWGKLQRGEDVLCENGVMIYSKTYILPPAPPITLVISGDNDNPSLLRDACKTANILIHEATFLQDIMHKVGEKTQHSSAALVAKFAEEVGVPNLVLTHFSSRYPDTSELEKEAKTFYRGHLCMANDFDEFQLNNLGELGKSTKSA
ncbi:MAG: ribonuclease Z [Methylococcales bacterium]|jgi:ribonuclease Z|nr:ribonuclease Z [Methylococcales bacterium]